MILQCFSSLIRANFSIVIFSRFCGDSGRQDWRSRFAGAGKLLMMIKAARIEKTNFYLKPCVFMT